MYKASYWIKKLQLKPHPEGGFYSRVYKSDEIWYFHSGASVVLHMISDEEKYIKVTIGNKERDAHLQYLVKAGTIFGAEVVKKESFSLISCMVSPGFDFDDFKLFSTNYLIQKYPQYTNLIKQFT